MPEGNPIAMYDFTIPVDLYSVETLQSILRKNCKRWCFQKEEGASGYIHYQCRISLIKRRRYSHLLKQAKEGTIFLKGNFSPTSNPTFYKGDMFYVMKEDTRIEGPWSDTDEIKTLTKQLKIFQTYELRCYQKAIMNEATKFDFRKINLIWDTTGNCGKSMLAEHMEYLGIAEEIPPFRMMDDIFQWVCSRGIKHGFKPCYIVDMPRGMKKDKLGDFYSGIEVIKNGVAYDKRYQGTKCRFDRPRIFVFTNTLPCFDLMSKDRWETWKIFKTNDNDYSFKIIHTDT